MSREQILTNRKFRKKISLYERMEDMISIGAYEAGSNPELDQIIAAMPAINHFLQQETGYFSSREDSAQRLLSRITWPFLMGM